MDNNQPFPLLTFAEINLSNLAQNYRELRRLASEKAKMMAVVKADGYGHGAIEVSKVALDNGADYLAVARVNEAKSLREGGIEAPILLFGYCDPEYVSYMANNDIWASVSDSETAEILSQEATRTGDRLKVHVKVDTGMGRLGFVADQIACHGNEDSSVNQAVEDVLRIANLPSLEVEGIYTHFANADAGDKTHAKQQFAIFSELLEELEQRSFQVPFRHAANSAATIELPETHLDLVRPGIAQYGLWPSPETDKSLISLLPVMTLKTKIIQLKQVPDQFKISYGSTYSTPAETRIATVPIGYADGFDRILSSRGSMLVRGKRAAIVGRVCMDLTMIDVGHIDDARINDEVVVFGRQGNAEITAEEVAERVSTINYEIVSSLTSRVEKQYVR